VDEDELSIQMEESNRQDSKIDTEKQKADALKKQIGMSTCFLLKFMMSFSSY
jgi:hypothetical protein